MNNLLKTDFDGYMLFTSYGKSIYILRIEHDRSDHSFIFRLGYADSRTTTNPELASIQVSKKTVDYLRTARHANVRVAHGSLTLIANHPDEDVLGKGLVLVYNKRVTIVIPKYYLIY